MTSEAGIGCGVVLFTALLIGYLATDWKQINSATIRSVDTVILTLVFCGVIICGVKITRPLLDGNVTSDSGPDISGLNRASITVM